MDQERVRKWVRRLFLESELPMNRFLTHVDAWHSIENELSFSQPRAPSASPVDDRQHHEVRSP